MWFVLQPKQSTKHLSPKLSKLIEIFKSNFIGFYCKIKKTITIKPSLLSIRATGAHRDATWSGANINEEIIKY